MRFGPRLAPAASRALELMRYGLIGASCVACNIVIAVFFTEIVGLNYLVSIAICFVVVTLFGFCMNRGWTFGRREKGVPRDLLRYLAVTLAQMPVSLVLCAVCVNRLGMSYVTAMLLVSAISFPATYALHRCWSFGLRWSQS